MNIKRQKINIFELKLKFQTQFTENTLCIGALHYQYLQIHCQLFQFFFLPLQFFQDNFTFLCKKNFLLYEFSYSICFNGLIILSTFNQDHFFGNCLNTIIQFVSKLTHIFYLCQFSNTMSHLFFSPIIKSSLLSIYYLPMFL